MLSNIDDTEFTCSLPTWLQFIIFIYLVDCGLWMYKCYIESTTQQQTNEQMFHAVSFFPS